MATPVTQVRLPEKVTQIIDHMVDKGLYTSRSDVIRDAVRRLLIQQQIGTIKSKKNSVKEVRAIRDKMTEKDLSLKELNALYNRSSGKKTGI